MTSLPTNLPDIASAQLPAAYEAAQRALAECASMDECKEWADKAAALASYAKQANDDQLHQLATRIQARAIRRCGELLSEIEPAPNHHVTRADGGPSSRKQAAEEAGLSERQRKTALRVAAVPEEEFEAAVEADEPATVTELAARGTKRPLVDLQGRDPEEFALATRAQGAIQRLAEFAVDADPAAIARGMFPRERATVEGNVTTIGQWLARLMREIRQQ